MYLVVIEVDPYSSPMTFRSFKSPYNVELNLDPFHVTEDSGKPITGLRDDNIIKSYIIEI